MITLKKIKSIIKESNFASYGGIRGLGAVTGEAGSATNPPGMNTVWIGQCATGAQENTDAHQALQDDHNQMHGSNDDYDLHNEIEDNDLNPKDKGKRIRIQTEK